MPQIVFHYPVETAQLTLPSRGISLHPIHVCDRFSRIVVGSCIPYHFGPSILQWCVRKFQMWHRFPSILHAGRVWNAFLAFVPMRPHVVRVVSSIYRVWDQSLGENSYHSYQVFAGFWVYFAYPETCEYFCAVVDNSWMH